MLQDGVGHILDLAIIKKAAFDLDLLFFSILKQVDFFIGARLERHRDCNPPLIAKDLNKLQVWAQVNEADMGRIHEGSKTRVKSVL